MDRAVQLETRVPICELPAHGRPGGVARVFQRACFPDERFLLAHASIPAQAVKDPELDFGHVQLTAMFGHVM